MSNSCMNCKERHANCHSTCKEYIEWKANHEERKATIRKEKEKLYTWQNYKSNIVRETKEGKRR
jgi:hypothetical protein